MKKNRAEEEAGVWIRGPYEYKNPDRAESPSPERVALLNRVYSRLDYDLSFPLSIEHIPEDIQDGALSFSTAEAKTLFADTAAGRIGFLLLPREAGEQSRIGMQKTIERLRKDPEVVLVVAVSSLGAKEENALFSDQDFSPDVFLGGGPGAGMRGRVKDNGQTLWVRPYPRGTAVSVIRFYSLTGRSGEHTWVKNETVEFDALPLRGKYKRDKEILDILTGKPDKGN
ncbi:MAG: hypothetical protein ACLFSY_10010 [Desulfonatronovibrionaceae bacterium]